MLEAKVIVPGYEMQIKDLIALYSKTFIKQLYENLVDVTPVNSGRARASWQILQEGESPEFLPRGQYGPPKTPEFDLPKEGGLVVIANTVSYMFYLNEGSSEQAPSGFVELTINETISQMTQ